MPDTTSAVCQALPQTQASRKPLPFTPAQQARHAAGYGGTDGLRQAAAKLRAPVRTVRKYELHGGAPAWYCQRAAYLFGCNPDVFFHPANYEREQSRYRRQSNRLDLKQGRDTLPIPLQSVRDGNAGIARGERMAKRNNKPLRSLRSQPFSAQRERREKLFKNIRKIS